MQFSIIICTYNRSRLLAHCLDSLHKLRIPNDITIEVIVVNNNSNDDTQNVIDFFSRDLPIISLFEPRSGKSHALNRAIQEARGDWFLFTDDDVIVCEEWLEAYKKAIMQHSHAVFFGGPIEPWFEVKPPRWLCKTLNQISGVYALRDKSQMRGCISTEYLPYGANMCVKAVIHRNFSYDTRLGVTPTVSPRGEEVTLLKTLLDQGFLGHWVPDARVFHYIPEKRLTRRYIREFYFGIGHYRVLTEGYDSGTSFLGAPRWLYRKAISAELRYQFFRWLKPPEIWVPMLVKASIQWGMLSAHRYRSHSIHKNG